LPTARAARTAQVKQEKLRYIDPVAKEAMNATRTAFGADYEARLRAEAGAKPDKLSRRKHQISSLYHNAKMKARPRARSGLPGRGPGRPVQRSGALPPSLLHPALSAGPPPCQPLCLQLGPRLAAGPTARSPAPGATTWGCRGRAGAGDAGHAQPGHEDQGADSGQVWLVAPAGAQGPRCKFHSVQACGMGRGWLSRHSASACRDGVCKQRPAVRHHGAGGRLLRHLLYNGHSRGASTGASLTTPDLFSQSRAHRPCEAEAKGPGCKSNNAGSAPPWPPLCTCCSGPSACHAWSRQVYCTDTRAHVSLQTSTERLFNCDAKLPMADHWLPGRGTHAAPAPWQEGQPTQPQLLNPVWRHASLQPGTLRPHVW